MKLLSTRFKYRRLLAMSMSTMFLAACGGSEEGGGTESNNTPSPTSSVSSTVNPSVTLVPSATVVPNTGLPIAQSDAFHLNEDTVTNFRLYGTDENGLELTFTLTENPQFGVISGDLPNLTYTPNAHFNGLDSLAFTVNNGTQDSLPATIEFNVAPLNDAPYSQNQSVTVVHGSKAEVNITATDVDGDELTYTVIESVANGTLSSDAPVFVYTPNGDFVGKDVLTYTVSDADVTSEEYRVEITVRAQNNAPVSDSQRLSLNEDETLDITLAASDVDGDDFTFSINQAPSYGVLAEVIEGDASNLVYTPNENYHGADTFSFSTQDHYGLASNVAVVELTVLPVNDQPVAIAQTITVAEDTATLITLGGTDVETEALVSNVVTQPNHGSLTGTAPNLTYTPTENFNGTDRFTFSVFDGELSSDIVAISINVNAVTDGPIANNQSINLFEDDSQAITLTATTPEAGEVTFAIVEAPKHGQLTGTASNYVYTPSENYVGVDSFTFTATANDITSAVGTISLNVLNVNDLPVAEAANISVNEDATIDIVLGASDLEAEALTFRITEQVSNGQLTGSANRWTYTPNANFNGLDSFKFVAADSKGDSNTATVSITVLNVNDVPVATTQTFTLLEDTPLAITPNVSDADADALTFSISTAPVNGTITQANGMFTYTPALNSYGSDSFEYLANDGKGGVSELTTINLTISPVNDKPVANALTLNTNEDVVLAITLSGSDIDGDDITHTVVTSPSNGQLSGSGANMSYKPAANYHGSDSFTYYVNDGVENSDAVTVAITINSVDDVPTAVIGYVTVNEDTSKAFEISGVDLDGDTLTYTIVTQPTSGNVTGVAPHLTYTPHDEFTGFDFLEFTVTAGGETSSVAKVTFDVAALNDRPVANAQTVSVNEDTSVAITLTGSDPEGFDLTYSTASQPNHGSITIEGAVVTYTPASDFFGTDSFTFTVNDGVIDSEAAIVTINVAPINDAPVGVNQSVITDEDVAITITPTATDVDDTTITFEVQSAPTLGSVVVTNSKFVYTPAKDKNGLDQFTYFAKDSAEASSELTTVVVQLTALEDKPVATSDTVVLNEDGNIAFVLDAYDGDGDALTYNVYNSVDQGELTGTAPNLIYTPNENYNGSDALFFNVSDGKATSNNVQVAFTVNSVNDIPSVAETTFYVDYNGSAAITLDVTDVENNSLTYTVTDPVDSGILAGAAPNFTYAPAKDSTVTEQFTVNINDGFDSIDAVITLLVDLPPVALAQMLTTDEDVNLDITLTGTDDNNADLVFTITTQPENGLLTGVSPNFTYVPNEHFNGTDSFSYTANDGRIDSEVATTTITINAVEDDPIATSRTVQQYNVHTGIYGQVGYDPDGDDLTIDIITDVQFGTLNSSVEPWTYIPNPGFVGQDSIVFTASSNGVTSEQATLTIDVKAPPAKDFSVGLEYTCVKDNGVQKCWGDNQSNIEDSSAFTNVQWLDSVGNTACAINKAANDNLSAVCAGYTYYNVDAYPELTQPVQVTTSWKTACALHQGETTTTEVKCWGDGNETSLEVPILENPTAIYSNAYYQCAMDQGQLVCWGGDESFIDELPVVTDQDIFDLGYRGACMVNSTSGQVECWGNLNNNFNELPVLTNATDIATGYNGGCAIEEDSTNSDNTMMTCWGSDSIKNAPSMVNPFDVEMNYNHVCAKAESGLHCWGYSSDTDKSELLIPFLTDYNGSNQVPVALDTVVNVTEGSSVTVTLPATDADGDALTAVVKSHAILGSYSIEGLELTVTQPEFNPRNGYIHYIVSDGKGISQLASAYVNVTDVNDAPIAIDPGTLYLKENTARNFRLLAKDIDKGDQFSYEFTTDPSHGVISGTGPLFKFTPEVDFVGVDTFSYVIKDLANASSESITVSVDISADYVSDVPDLMTVGTSSCMTDEAGLVCWDANGYVESPEHKSITAMDGYYSNKCFISDLGITCTGSGDITENIPSIVNPSKISVGRHSACVLSDAGVECFGSDNRGVISEIPVLENPIDLVSYENNMCALDQTSEGNEVHCWGNSSYVVDGEHPKLAGATEIAVNSRAVCGLVEGALVCSSSSTSAYYNYTHVNSTNAQLTSISMDGSDMCTSEGEGDSQLVKCYRYYTSAMSASDVYAFEQYSSNYCQIFEYYASCSNSSGNATTQQIPIIRADTVASNQQPIAVDVYGSAQEGQTVVIELAGTDVNGDELTYHIDNAISGSYSVSGSTLTWSPTEDFAGYRTVTYHVNDGELDSSQALAYIYFYHEDDVFTLSNTSKTLNEDASNSRIYLSYSNPDLDELFGSVLTPPKHGVVSGTYTNLYYQVDADYFGNDSFEYSLRDNYGNSETITVSMTINPINDKPLVENQSFEINEEQSVLVQLSATDVDGDELTFITSTPSNGTLTGSFPTWEYTPNDNYFGVDSFSYTANDGTVNSDSGLVSFTIANVEDLPIAQSQGFLVSDDSAIAVTLVATDGDSDELTYNLVTDATDGTFTGTYPNMSYTPNSPFSGIDFIEFNVSDGDDVSNTARVSFKASGNNTAPVAVAGSVSTEEDTAVEVTLVATDANLEPLNYSISVAPTNGAMTRQGEVWTYTPNQDYVGADSFEFIANDGFDDSNSALVTIDVTAVNDAPVGTPAFAYYAVNQDGTGISSAVVLTGSDVEGSDLTFEIADQPSNGTLSGTPPNMFYTANTHFKGNDQFSFKVNDGMLDSVEFAAVIMELNLAPVVADSSQRGLIGTPITLNVLATDEENDALTYEVDAQPANGVVTTVDGKLLYTPNSDAVLSDTVSIKAFDGLQYSNLATVTLEFVGLPNQILSNSDSVACAIDDNGLTCWGKDSNGILNQPALNNPISVSVNSRSACVLDKQADSSLDLVCWGYANYFSGYDSLSNVVAVTPAYNSHCAVIDNAGDYSVTCFGGSSSLNTTLDVEAPIDFAIGTDAACVLDAGTLNCWGNETRKFAEVPSLGNILEIDAYNRNICVLHEVEGEYLQKCWGDYTYYAAPIDTLEVPKALTIGASRSCLIDTVDSVENSLRCNSTMEEIPTVSDIEYMSINSYGSVFCLKEALGVACFWGGAEIQTVPNLTFNGVTMANNVPTGSDISGTILEDSSDNIIALNFSDPDGQFLKISSLGYDGPAYAGLSDAGMNISTRANQHGLFQYVLSASDARNMTNKIIANITVTPENDAPVVESRKAIVAKNTPLSISLLGSDADYEPLVYSIVTQPTHGSIVIEGDKAIYTPESEYLGADSFEYKANDGTIDSDDATVMIDVVETKPTRHDLAIQTNRADCWLQETSVDCMGYGHYTSGYYHTALNSMVLENPTHLSMGYYYGCLNHDAGLVCWNRSNRSDTYTGTKTDTIYDTPTVTQLVDLAVYDDNACIIDVDQLHCWGPDASDAATFDTVSQLESDTYHICALGTENSAPKVACWGSSQSSGASSELVVPTLTNPTEILATDEGSCALDDTGLVCWGDIAAHAPTLNDVQAMTAGFYHICALDLNVEGKKEVSCFVNWTTIDPVEVADDVTDIMIFNGDNYCTFNGSWSCPDAWYDDTYDQIALKVDDVELNSVPYIRDQDFYTHKNESLTFTLPVFDAEGDVITVTEESISNGASVVISGTEVTITPALDYVGNEYVNFTVSDGELSKDYRFTISVIE